MALAGMWSAQRARWRSLGLVLWLGVRSQPLAVSVALVATWGGVVLAVEAAAAGAVIGAFVSMLLFLSSHIVDTVFHHTGETPFGAGAGSAFLVLTVVAGSVGGALGGFLIVAVDILSSPGSLVAALVCGTVLALVLTAVVYFGELWLLARQGYRRLSYDEALRVRPLLSQAALALGMALEEAPPLLITDTVLPEARAHMRAITVSRGMLTQLNDWQLAGVLAHELAHWDACDPVGSRLIWACALPLVVIHGLLRRIAEIDNAGVLVALFQAWFWPVDLSIRLVIAPAASRDRRLREYAADATTMAAGAVYREGLKSALEHLQVLESPRKGWEAALYRTHPPTALRVERLVSEDEARRRGAAWGATGPSNRP